MTAEISWSNALSVTENIKLQFYLIENQFKTWYKQYWDKVVLDGIIFFKSNNDVLLIHKTGLLLKTNVM